MSSATIDNEKTVHAMDSSGYKGDSIGKKIARIYLWERIVSSLRSRGMDDGKIAYLASRDGGDAAALAAIGWPESQQLAIDRDAGALAEFSRKHPKVPTAHGDAGRVIANHPEKFVAIYLDFCSPGTNEVLDTIAKCVPRVRHMGRLAYCAMRGRERGPKATNIRLVGIDTKAARAAGGAQIVADLLGDGPTEVPEGMVHPRLIDARTRITDGRSDLFEEYVQKKMMPHRIELRFLTFIVYQSDTPDGRGVPMMIDDWEIDHMGKGISIERFNRIRLGITRELMMVRAAQLLEIYGGVGYGVIECRVPDLPDVVRMSRCNLDLHGANIGNLIELSDQLELTGRNAAMALGMSPRTLAAYRAHYTMDRYESGHIVMT